MSGGTWDLLYLNCAINGDRSLITLSLTALEVCLLT